MGATASKFTDRLTSRFRSSPIDTSRSAGEISRKTDFDYLVRSRRGSMYRDRDGDLAHEFYEEVSPSIPGQKATMRRVVDNLIPQGEVSYTTARLTQDYPYIVADI